MNAKEYLSQAYLLEQQVRSKLAQIESLRSLASCITPRPTNQPPVDHTRNVHSMEDTLLKIYEMNRELDEQIDELVDKKIEITQTILQVQDVNCRFVLERRYLEFETREDIAADLHYSVKTVTRIHKQALEMVQEILDSKERETSESSAYRLG